MLTMAPATKAKYKYPIHKKTAPHLCSQIFNPARQLTFRYASLFLEESAKVLQFLFHSFLANISWGKIFGGWGSATNQSVTKLENVWKSCSAIYYMLLILQIQLMLFFLFCFFIFFLFAPRCRQHCGNVKYLLLQSNVSALRKTTDRDFSRLCYVCDRRVVYFLFKSSIYITIKYSQKKLVEDQSTCSE